MELTVRLSDEQLDELAQRAAALVLAQLGAERAQPEFMTPEAAAAYLSCSRQRIYDLVSSGRLPRHKDGARLLLRRSDLDAHLSAGAGGAPRVPAHRPPR